jgi:hypothetical protein
MLLSETLLNAALKLSQLGVHFVYASLQVSGHAAGFGFEIL